MLTRPSRWLARVCVVPLAVLAGCQASAQSPLRPTPDRLARQPRIRAALETVRADNAWTVEQQVSLCEIPAPPFKERARANELERRFRSLGLTRVRIDSEGNVIGERPGAAAGPTVVISGHLDTVFPEGTDVKVKREGARLRAPGISDDCRGLAAMLAVIRAMQQNDVRTRGRVLFVGTVGEEGAGNLRGVRHLFARELKDSVDFFVSVDGAGVQDITSRAVGSHRYRVRFIGPGGHSYSAFGMPNPMHALGRAIAAISDMQVPATPKTTFNVGIVRGGTSVNSIAFEGSFDLDLRSESQQALDDADRLVRIAIETAVQTERARWPESAVALSAIIDTIGIRPAGAQPDSAMIVRAAIAAGRALGIVSHTSALSTDANVPIALGIPAITIGGGGTEDKAHSLDEWYEDGPDAHRGPQRIVLLIAMLAGVR